LLCSLQDQEYLPGLRDFLLCKEVELFVDWYIPYAYKRKLEALEFDEFIELWQNTLAKQPNCREYHFMCQL